MNTEKNTTPLAAEILIVEDSPTQALILRRLLEQRGCNVAVAGSGELALDLLRQRRPTLIISDVNMPGMDGYELCRRVKADPALRDTPLMLLTTLSDPHDVIRGLECGAHSFMTKPYDERQLLSRIRYILANEQLRRQKPPEAAIEIEFAGQKYAIAAGRDQILDFLLSTYETAVEQNRELRAAGEALEHQKQELARSNAELQQFAYVASHDLQEPLRTISCFLKLLDDRYRGQLDKSGREFIAFAVDGAHRMSQLINDLLTYARVDSRGKPIVPTDAARAVNAALANLRVAIAESGAQVDCGPLPAVKADEAQLIQLFQNLVANAVKFRRKDAPPRVAISAVRAGAECAFTVRDNGIGIDPAHFHMLFQIFKRLHTREEYPGTGIGLAVCKKIVERHGGRIWVESGPGQGAAFSFTLAAAG
jgi:hypothetical protein